MPRKLSGAGRAVALAGLLLICGFSPVRDLVAGDSLYGKVIRVTAADTVVLDYGAGRYELHLVGIVPPTDDGLAREATRFVSDLVLGKPARTRVEYRADDGTMLARLFTDDPILGVREVAVELVRSGLAVPQDGFDDPDGLLAQAETEARKAGRGLWSKVKQN